MSEIGLDERRIALEEQKLANEASLARERLAIERRQIGRFSGGAVTVIGSVIGIVSAISTAIIVGVFDLQATRQNNDAQFSLKQEEVRAQLDIKRLEVEGQIDAQKLAATAEKDRLQTQQKFEIIVQATKGLPREVAVENLSFFVEAGILDDPDGKILSLTKEGKAPELPPERTVSLESIPPIAWAENADSPDYRHLSNIEVDNIERKPFLVNKDSIEYLLQVNNFSPMEINNKIILALRGALIEKHVINVSEIVVTEVKPNHLIHRSVFIILDRATGNLSGFVGSTVPNALSVTRHFTGKGFANLLPTGMYPYRVFSHGWDGARQQYKVTPALRFGHREDVSVAVRRTRDNLVYDIKDVWDNSVVNDNVHPSFSTTAFSSAGALTIKGSMERFTSNMTGDYNLFFKLLGDWEMKQPLDIVLLTGLEAALASKIREERENSSSKKLDFRRLRAGSSGPLVAELQRALGLTPDGNFGSRTTMALADMQNQKFGWSDGIYSPEMDCFLELDIFDGKC